MPSEGKVFTLNAGFIEQLIHNAGEDCYGEELWAAKYNFTAQEALIQTYLDTFKSNFYKTYLEKK